MSFLKAIHGIYSQENQRLKAELDEFKIKTKLLANDLPKKNLSDFKTAEINKFDCIKNGSSEEISQYMLRVKELEDELKKTRMELNKTVLF